MKNPIRPIIDWFKLEARLVDSQDKRIYTYLYKA